MTDWLTAYSELSYGLVLWACRVLIHSTLLISVGLLTVRILGPGRAPQRSSILRCVLIAVLIGPFLSILGLPGLLSVYLPLEPPVYTYAASQQNSLPPDKSGQVNDVSADPVSTAGRARSSVTFQTKAETVRAIQPEPAYHHSGILFGELVSLYCSLSTVWLGGTAFLLIRLGAAFVQIKRLRKCTTDATEETTVLCHRLARKMGIRPPVVLISSHIPSPVLAGVLKPVILLPASCAHQTNEQVLAHELAHFQRRDCIWNLMGHLITALYFFQPLLWALIRHLEETSEEVCDGYVLFYTGQRTNYARRLVEMAEELGFCPRINLAGIGIIGLRSSLGRRVQRILDRGNGAPIRTSLSTLVSIHSAGLVVVLLICLVGIRSAHSGQRARWQSFNASIAQRDIGSPGHTQALVETLSSHDANERARAVQALGKMGTPTQDVTTHLVKGLKDEDWLVRKAAAQALANMGSEARCAVVPLTQSLGDQEWLVRESSAYALGAIGFVNQTPVLALIKALDDQEWQVRKAAAFALTALGSTATAAVPRLSRALLDPEWQVRHPAAQALAAIGAPAYPAVSNLIRTLRDDQWHVRQHAGAALAAIGPRARPAVSQLVVLLSDEEWQVRKSAALALGAIGPEAACAIPTLIKCLDDPEWHCRHAATEALEKTALGNKMAIPGIIDALLDSEWNKRKGVARSLQRTL